jgi:hypothetical protein
MLRMLKRISIVSILTYITWIDFKIPMRQRDRAQRLAVLNTEIRARASDNKDFFEMRNNLQEF